MSEPLATGRAARPVRPVEPVEPGSPVLALDVSAPGSRGTARVMLDLGMPFDQQTEEPFVRERVSIGPAANKPFRFSQGDHAKRKLKGSE